MFVACRTCRYLNQCGYFREAEVSNPGQPVIARGQRFESEPQDSQPVIARGQRFESEPQDSQAILARTQ